MPVLGRCCPPRPPRAPPPRTTGRPTWRCRSLGAAVLLAPRGLSSSSDYWPTDVTMPVLRHCCPPRPPWAPPPRTTGPTDVAMSIPGCCCPPRPPWAPPPRATGPTDVKMSIPGRFFSPPFLPPVALVHSRGFFRRGWSPSWLSSLTRPPAPFAPPPPPRELGVVFPGT
jgi:hypothetical protein